MIMGTLLFIMHQFEVIVSVAKFYWIIKRIVILSIKKDGDLEILYKIKKLKRCITIIIKNKLKIFNPKFFKFFLIYKVK